jgi:hypothetical protein
MRGLLVVTGVVAAIAISGCGSTTAPSLEGAKLSAATVLQQTAQKAEDVTSYSADLVLDFSGDNGDAGNVQGTLLYQSTPQVASDITLSQLTYAGQSVPGGVRVILRDDTAYVKLDLLKALMGATKPWVKIDLKELGSAAGVDVDRLLGQVQQIDLKTSAALLTASKDVKAVGSEQVGGVDTTHYAGTFPVEEAVKLLAPEVQSKLKGQMSGVRDMKFNAWIDAQGLPRKIGLNGGAGAGTFKATLLFKAFNEPVSIEAPPADQVGELPKTLPTD